MNKQKENLGGIYRDIFNEEVIDLSNNTNSQVSQIIKGNKPTKFDLSDNTVVCPNCGEDYCENGGYCEQCNNCKIDESPKKKKEKVLNKNYNGVELKEIGPNNSYIILKYGEKRQLKIYLENVQFKEKEISLYDGTSEKQELVIKKASFRIKSIQKKVKVGYNEREVLNRLDFYKVREVIEYFLVNK